MNNSLNLQVGDFIRQGDVGLIYLGDLDTPIPSPQMERQGDVILALGETSGHAHRIKDRAVEMFGDTEVLFIRVIDTGKISHEEHDTHTLPAGVYQIARQIEADFSDLFVTRRVID